jgi:hypothetical protein
VDIHKVVIYIRTSPSHEQSMALTYATTQCTVRAAFCVWIRNIQNSQIQGQEVNLWVPGAGGRAKVAAYGDQTSLWGDAMFWN